MLTNDVLFGMNILTLAGFVVMGLSLTLHRMAAAGRPLSVGLMCAGTALVFIGLYAGSFFVKLARFPGLTSSSDRAGGKC